MEGFVRKPDILSFSIASKIPISESTRQELLEINGVSYRLRREIELLEGFDRVRCKNCQVLLKFPTSFPFSSFSLLFRGEERMGEGVVSSEPLVCGRIGTGYRRFQIQLIDPPLLLVLLQRPAPYYLVFFIYCAEKFICKCVNLIA